MTPLMISIAAFIGVAALVGGVAILLRGDAQSDLEDRLAVLTSSSKDAASVSKNLVLSSPLDDGKSLVGSMLSRIRGLSKLFAQADTTLTPTRFLVISVAFGVVASTAFTVAGLHPAVIPAMAVLAALLPTAWLLMRRRKRFRLFAKQLPDALELISRALRAGHSLAAGFNLVASEMSDPIGTEFGRVFEEQNLGIAFDEALDNLTDRVPNLDLRFFTMAVILQRQTGGDLAEILDKISRLIRERFALWGTVQALTGEGRLSGIVLLALPPVLFVVVWRLNPDYVSVLFTDPLGKKMLFGAVVLQVLGALVIKKIVNIKV